MKSFIKIIIVMTSLLVSANLYSQNSSENKNQYNSVDEHASFQGGEVDKFILWAFSNIKYPEEALKNNIKGKVLLKFVISKEGKVKDITILKSSGSKLLDDEAIRVVSLSPDWEPAKVKGEPVPIFYVIPFAFDYTNEQKSKQAENKEDNSKSTEPVSLSMVDEKPTFQGKEGLNDFTKWMFSELIYPKEAKDQKIMGRTILEFVVSKEGKVKNVKILRSSGNKLLDDEAVRVVSLSPDWQPGKLKGKPVDVKYTFPVVFMLR